MARFRGCAVALLVAAVLFAGCENTEPSGDEGLRPAGAASGDAEPPEGSEGLKAVEPVSNLESFSSDEELAAYLKERFLPSVQPVDLGGLENILPIMPPMPLMPLPMDGVVALDAALAPTAGALDAVGGGYSTTNIQEQGVDESDVVKTDGTHLYVAAGLEVKVVRAVPPNRMAVIGAIPVGGRVDSMYLYRGAASPGRGNGEGHGPKEAGRVADPPGLHEELLIVLYRHNPGSGAPAPEGIPEGRNHPRTGVLVVDVANPASPAVVREMLFEGSLEASRLTGGRLHLVGRFTPRVTGLRLWYDGSEEDLAVVEADNQATLDGLILDDLVPAYYEIDGDGAVAGTGRAVEAVDFARPADPAGSGIVTVVTIDLDDLSSGFRSCAAVADVDIVYASRRALYLAHKIMSHTEDPEPPPLTGYDYGKQTVIRKFDLTADRVRNVASGRVWGHPLNQFSLGEHDDVLRIATTTGFRWRTGGSTWRNHVFCLAPARGTHLDIVGSIENIAPTERIYSARFIGERGFLVTFRRTDPLFTLDLSDPTNPVLVGELVVPGYSDYIHLLGGNHLLTIGKQSSRVSLSIFDVTDFANPTLLHRELIGPLSWSDSEALRNHKAFTFWAERDLLAIPMRFYELVEGTYRCSVGLHVYRVTVAGGFERLGRIDTSPEGSSYYRPGWTRGVFIADDVYAVTPDVLSAAAVDDIGREVWSVALAGE